MPITPHGCGLSTLKLKATNSASRLMNKFALKPLVVQALNTVTLLPLLTILFKFLKMATLICKLGVTPRLLLPITTQWLWKPEAMLFLLIRNRTSLAGLTTPQTLKYLLILLTLSQLDTTPKSMRLEPFAVHPNKSSTQLTPTKTLPTLILKPTPGKNPLLSKHTALSPTSSLPTTLMLLNKLSKFASLVGSPLVKFKSTT